MKGNSNNSNNHHHQQQHHNHHHPHDHHHILNHPHYGRYRRVHYIFLFLFALFTALFIAGCSWFINFQFIFQSGIIGFFHVLTGILIGIYITSTVTDYFYFVPRDMEEEIMRRHRDALSVATNTPSRLSLNEDIQPTTATATATKQNGSEQKSLKAYKLVYNRNQIN